MAPALAPDGAAGGGSRREGRECEQPVKRSGCGGGSRFVNSPCTGSARHSRMASRESEAKTCCMLVGYADFAFPQSFASLLDKERHRNGLRSSTVVVANSPSPKLSWEKITSFYGQDAAASPPTETTCRAFSYSYPNLSRSDRSLRRIRNRWSVSGRTVIGRMHVSANGSRRVG
jgi:hypothetical protein